jgi:GTP-binding protein
LTRVIQSARETRVVDAKFVAAAGGETSLPAPTLLEVAFAGRSNVGKSSLLNAMMQRRGLARTSHTPGCTRQINVFEVRCADGLALRFVDLPGYGWARRSKAERGEWQTMVEGYLKGRAALRAVVLLVDVRRGPEEEESQLLEFLKERATGAAKGANAKRALEVVTVATKIDKVGPSRTKPALDAVRRALEAIDVRGGAIGFSVVTGQGREELWARIRRVAL